MKIQKLISLILAVLLVVPVFLFPASAIVPPSDEIQWTNTTLVSCNIIVLGTDGSACASIVGKPGATIQATVVFYETIGGAVTTLYSDSKISSGLSPMVTFVHDLTVQGGATYYLELNGIVSKDGYDEIISFSDTEYVPPIPPMN